VRSCFLDTSFLIALEASDDQCHQQAKSLWCDFKKHPLPLVTTSYIADEISTFFNRRNPHAKAVEIVQNLMDSPSVFFVHINEDLFNKGWQFFKKHDDKRFSLTDCISFAVMHDMKLTMALTFDKHFAQAGFEMKP